MSNNREQPDTTATITVYVAAVARGNPGLSGAGIVIVRPRGEPERIARYLGNASALDAQLQALSLALRYARVYAPAPLEIAMGNETAARQLGGEQPPRHPSVLRMIDEIDRLLAPFERARLRLAVHGELAEAENLAELGIDTRLRPLPSYDRPPPT